VKARVRLLNEFNIEISGGLGDIKSTTWRIGLMGYSSQRQNVLLFLAALEQVLSEQGMKLPIGAGLAAAVTSFAHAEPVTAGQGK
jgi:alanine-glyoxylate transaminase/serine-glyoxylate transaminase/serine-pyruvate transaminase